MTMPVWCGSGMASLPGAWLHSLKAVIAVDAVESDRRYDNISARFVANGRSLRLCRPQGDSAMTRFALLAVLAAMRVIAESPCGRQSRSDRPLATKRAEMLS